MESKMTVTSKLALTSLLHQLGAVKPKPLPLAHASTPDTHVSTLANLDTESASQARSTLMTLHFLFPHELLPALDLLDRKLVTGLRYRQAESLAAEVFYIQSASAVTESHGRRPANSRFKNAGSAARVYYEVRLDSWNCSCAAFAQSHMKLLLAHAPGNQKNDATGEADFGQSLFGGVATKADALIPTCKHILAAAIGSAAPCLFANGIQYEDVTLEALAAWAAGFGEA